MSKQTEALKLALEALEQMTRPRPSFDAHKNAITAIREALAEQPAQDGNCKHCTDGCIACDARKTTDVLF